MCSQMEAPNDDKEEDEDDELANKNKHYYGEYDKNNCVIVSQWWRSWVRTLIVSNLGCIVHLSKSYLIQIC